MLRLHSVCLLVLALTLGASANAQGALDDTTAWEPLGDARQQLQAFTFSGDPDQPTIWGGDSGVYRLDQIDGAWEQVFFFPQGGPMLFLGDPFGEPPPDTLFVGRGLYRSVDGGETFDRVESPAGGSDGRISPGGALDQFPPDSPYPGRLVSGDPPTTVYSDDGGDTWTRAETTPYFQAFRLHTFRSGRVVAAGFYGAILSRDGGQTYEPVPALYDTTQISFDLTEMLMLDGFVTGRPGDSEEGRLLVVGTQAGRPSTYVWASDDEGETWREIHAFEYSGSLSITDLPTSERGGPGWAVASDAFAGRVWATTDGGETWRRIGKVPGVGSNDTVSEVGGGPGWPVVRGDGADRESGIVVVPVARPGGGGDAAGSARGGARGARLGGRVGLAEPDGRPCDGFARTGQAPGRAGVGPRRAGPRGGGRPRWRGDGRPAAPAGHGGLAGGRLHSPRHHRGRRSRARGGAGERRADGRAIETQNSNEPPSCHPERSER